MNGVARPSNQPLAPFPLDARRILIVGGTSGIGLSAARALRAAGARLAVLGRADEHLPTAAEVLGGDATVESLDVSKPAEVDAAVVRCVERMGGLDGLYHVAGGSARSAGDGPLHELTDSAMDWCLRLNLAGVVASNRAAIRQFMAQGAGGSIVNLSSVLAVAPSPAYFSTHAYAAAKAAVIGLSVSSAAYYAPHNIRINVLAPGLVHTPMAQRAADDAVIQRFIHHKQPLDGGRIAAPADLDGAAMFLLSEASRFITGQVLAVDGGWSITDASRALVAGEGR
jgi:NAD(P)-dependent dehydrogenase (short-subunit alcohol dehydrogenase family)